MSKPTLIASIDFRQLVKYYIVGAMINIIGYLLFLLFIYKGIEHKLAASVLYIAGVFISFLLNRTIVFDSNVALHSGLARLALMLLSGYALNISILYLCVDKYSLNPGVIQLFSIALISILFYFANKYFVHRKP
jgi:putative flippase GtrA